MRSLVLLLAFVVGISTVGCMRVTDKPQEIESGRWRLAIDANNGGIVQLGDSSDATAMNWVREAGQWQKRNWIRLGVGQSSGSSWGLVETSQTGLLHAARVKQISATVIESVYSSACLTLTVRRELLANGELQERYTFTNTGPLDLEFPVGAVGIHAPLFDQYPDARRSLTARCHAHLWMGGQSAWINAMRMGAKAPHLGLVMTEGGLERYSQRGGTISDRGVFVLHPSEFKLGAGMSHTIGWRFFWHQGWDDFFRQAAESSQFVRLEASSYVVTRGESFEVRATARGSLEGASLLIDGKPHALKIQGNQVSAQVVADEYGDRTIELAVNGRRTWVRVAVVPPEDALIGARVKFILENQQRLGTGDPLDGAYLSFDNETGGQVYGEKPSDHNAARERVGMGVLAAMYYRRSADQGFRAEIEKSLRRFAAFVEREIEDEKGVVYGTVGRRDPERLYNFPWVAQFHLEMYRSFGDRGHLDRMVRVIRAYYAREGKKFYAIGLPVLSSLAALEEAKRTGERAELLKLYRSHADQILATGTDYPASEVNFEQSIVAPAVQLLLEVYLATKEVKYLEGAKQQMPLLEAFCGRQPDHRLNEIAIRHWDDYWFGKLRLYGDTFPHYWSTLNGTAYAYHALATKQANWAERARAVVRGNFSLFTPEGRGSAAHVYPMTLDGQPGEKNDPWANDQDWVLVNLLTLRELAGDVPAP